MQWDDLNFWSSLAWSNVQEKLDEYTRSSVQINPSRELMFRALDLIDLNHVNVCIMGQDPYPDPRLACGLAFSIPPYMTGFPPTLDYIFKEYCSDLHYPYPTCGDLTPWVSQGVLLWNAIPSCEANKSLSLDWDEWKVLTSEIVEALCKEGIVFVLLGGKARSFADVINYYEVVKPRENILIELCHPSPRANMRSRTEAKFLGSRLFSKINDSLETLGRPTIDWRLP